MNMGKRISSSFQTVGRFVSASWRQPPNGKRAVLSAVSDPQRPRGFNHPTKPITAIIADWGPRWHLRKRVRWRRKLDGPSLSWRRARCFKPLGGACYRVDCNANQRDLAKPPSARKSSIIPQPTKPSQAIITETINTVRNAIKSLRLARLRDKRALIA